MECVEGALKTSFRKEMGVQSTPQAAFDEFLAGNGENVMPCDDVFVDDLLDFSNQDGFVEPVPEKEEDEEEMPRVSLSLQRHQEQLVNFNSDLAGELIVPADLADLEWLSHFVEDSFSEFSVPHLTGTLTEKPNFLKETRSKPETPVPVQPCFKTPVPAKVRTKRPRTGGRVWSLGSPSLSESSSSSTSSSSSSFSSHWLIYTNPIEPISPLENPPAKKHKKKTTTEVTGGGATQPPRRCSHCGVQKTPQWRAGLQGAKTLCNACGVRFKSGRLLPEYRPACSPTFSNELHSNHHRKVLEMRRKKESTGSEPDLVSSF